MNLLDIYYLLHQCPETAFQEFKTQKLILDFLSNLDQERLEITTIGTGVLVYIKGNTEEVIGYRADIDALSIMEETNCAYQSTNQNMHACGHDVHMTVALGLIKNIIKEKIKRSFLFVFQPAEESGGGAFTILNSKVFKKYKIKEMYAIHIAPELKTNQIVIKEDVLFAYAQEIKIEIIGLESHGAKPYEGIDSIMIAATFLTQVQALMTRFIPDAKKIVSFGKINGGVAPNITARKTVLEGTIRTLDENIYLMIKDKIEKLASSLELCYGCKVNVIYEVAYPNVINDSNVTHKFRNFVSKTDYEIIDDIIYMYGEDFGAFCHEYPSLLCMIGVDAKYPLHHAKMLPNLESIQKTVDLYLEYFKNME